MNSLINLLKKENSIYVLAAIVYACDNNGIIKIDNNCYKNIVNTYLKHKIKKTAKTPHNTMNSTLLYFNGTKYFENNIDSLILFDKSDLFNLKQNALSKLNSKRINFVNNVASRDLAQKEIMSTTYLAYMLYGLEVTDMSIVNLIDDGKIFIKPPFILKKIGNFKSGKIDDIKYVIAIDKSISSFDMTKPCQDFNKSLSVEDIWKTQCKTIIDILGLPINTKIGWKLLMNIV